MKFKKPIIAIAALAICIQSWALTLNQIVLLGATGVVASRLMRPAQAHTKGDQPAHGQAPVGEVPLPVATGSFEGCKSFFPGAGLPVVPASKSARVHPLCFESFAVLYSGGTKTPVYTLEALDRQTLSGAGKEPRTNNFFEDTRIPRADRALLSDYKASGFDRGHNSPAGDMADATAMAQSFALTNMMPQAPQNNRNLWADVEKATRQYVKRAKGKVYVFTGSYSDAQSCPVVLGAARALQEKGLSIPNDPRDVLGQARRSAGYRIPAHFDIARCSIGSGVVVPSHIYKLVYDASTNRAWAHWVQNVDWAQMSAPISYAQLVQKTGIEFLPGVQLGN